MQARRSRKIGESRWLEPALIAVFSVVMSSCGGAQKTKAETCQTMCDEILASDDNEICSPMAVEQFETRVASWRQDCSAHAMANTKEKIAYKLDSALKCAEEKRRIEAKSKNCAQRLVDIEEGGMCLGRECSPFLEELQSIVVDCGSDELDDDYEEKARKQIDRFNERKRSGARLRKFRDLMRDCDGLVDKAAGNEAQTALNRVIKKVSKNKKLRKDFEENSEMDRLKMGALGACGLVIQTALVTICESVMEQVASNPKKKRRQRKKLNALKRRLRKIRPTKLFPGSTDVLEETIESLNN